MVGLPPALASDMLPATLYTVDIVDQSFLF